MTPLPRALALLAALTPLAARGAAPGEPFVAARRGSEVILDGRLEEPAWAAAPVFDGFVQRFPFEGQPPSERTEVRVLYDDHLLYVGVALHDRQPGAIQRPLGRRDSAPAADAVTVYVDSRRDGRTAFVFSLTAGGVLSDGLLSSEDEYNPEWDAIWQGAAAATEDGWTAELAIPLSALRFQDHGQPVFGFAVKRYLGRLHEEDWSAAVPRNVRGQISYFGTLEGLSALSPARDLEIVPYLAARLTAAPQYADDDTRPLPRLLLPSGEAGLDLKAALGRGLSLQATVNPDFGQVEADQVIQNLTTFEVLFPEKRPFFTQGMDLFRPVVPVNHPTPQQLFYSRRIGLDAPILAAAKLSGTASDTFQVGVVEAYVDGAGAGRPESDPDLRYRFAPEQPLWVGPRAAHPQLAPAPRNFLAGVVRWQPDPRATVGATVTSTILAGPRCTAAESELDDDTRPNRCNVLAGNAAAVDLDARSRDGRWYLRGQATASQAQGGAQVRTLADGTQLRPGDAGYGGFLTAGRHGGEPWRFDLDWEYASPRLDVNAVGYQRTQNEQLVRGILRYVRPTGGGPFVSWDAAALADVRTTTDGRGLVRGGQVYLGGEGQLRTFDWVGLNGWLNHPYWDVREIDQATVAASATPRPLAVEFPAVAGVELWYQTDPARPVVLSGDSGAGVSLGSGTLARVPFWWLGTNLTVRPHPRLETRLDVLLEQNGWSSRYISDDGADSPTYLFGQLVAPDLSITLRQLVVLAPQLTLQAYAQLFSGAGRYSNFHIATLGPEGGRISTSSLQPVSRPSEPLPAWWDNGDFHQGTLNLNVVLRWEYRLGSTLYLVYARSQHELGYPDDPGSPSPPYTLRPVGLGAGPATDSLLVKWSYWFGG